MLEEENISWVFISEQLPQNGGDVTVQRAKLTFCRLKCLRFSSFYCSFSVLFFLVWFSHSTQQLLWTIVFKVTHCETLLSHDASLLAQEHTGYPIKIKKSVWGGSWKNFEGNVYAKFNVFSWALMGLSVKNTLQWFQHRISFQPNSA